MFGRIGAIAVTGQGEILIYDSQATQLRRFAKDGTFLGPISGEGAGPGEYRNVTGMAVLPDDRLVFHDFGNMRFNVYSAEAEFLESWAQHTDVAEQRPVYTHGESGIYIVTDRCCESAAPWTMCRSARRSEPQRRRGLPRVSVVSCQHGVGTVRACPRSSHRSAG